MSDTQVKNNECLIGLYPYDGHFDELSSLREAEALFHKLVDSDSTYLSTEESLEHTETDDIQHMLDFYQHEMEIMKKTNEEIVEEKDKEIEYLKQKLKEKEMGTEQIPTKRAAKIREPESPLDIEAETIFTHQFFHDKGKVGIHFKKIHNKFYVLKTKFHTQSDQYVGIAQGLLIGDVIWWTPGNDAGTRITASSAKELARKIKQSFANGKNITMKFIVPSQPFNAIQIEKVYVPKKSKKNLHFLFQNFGRKKK